MNTNPAHGLLSALRTANVERQKEWKGSEGITLPFHANELYGECGELANVLKKILRLQTGIQGDLRLPSYELRNSLAHELADVLQIILGADLHRQRLGPQTVTAAFAARAVVLEPLEFLPNPR